jgi:hypothetical protein
VESAANFRPKQFASALVKNKKERVKVTIGRKRRGWVMKGRRSEKSECFGFECCQEQ